MTALNDSWVIGERELETATVMAATRQMLSFGFYYEWVWPEGTPNRGWIEARNEWAKAVRQTTGRNRPGLDTELLVHNACARQDPLVKNIMDTWLRYQEYKEYPGPTNKTVWLDPYWVDAVTKWAKKDAGLVWYRWQAMEEVMPLPCYGQGMDASTAPVNQAVIACSVGSQSDGKNLQRWSRNLFLGWPGGPKRTEQVIGRTHRQGQEADEVTVDWYCWHDVQYATYLDCLKRAAYVEETTLQRQKVLYATKVDFLSICDKH